MIILNNVFNGLVSAKYLCKIIDRFFYSFCMKLQKEEGKIIQTYFVFRNSTPFQPRTISKNYQTLTTINHFRKNELNTNHDV